MAKVLVEIELVGDEQAAARFRREHPDCPHCGEALFEKLTYQCTMCGANLKVEHSGHAGEAS